MVLHKFHPNGAQALDRDLIDLVPGYDYSSDSYEISGFGYQGWNDGCSQQATDDYESNLVNLIHDIRAEFKTHSYRLDRVVGVWRLGSGQHPAPRHYGRAVQRHTAL